MAVYYVPPTPAVVWCSCTVAAGGRVVPSFACRMHGSEATMALLVRLRSKE